MSSCEVVQLPARGTLDVFAHQIPEVLRALLHTIIFHRALGLVRPQEVDSQLFDLTWVSCTTGAPGGPPPIQAVGPPNRITPPSAGPVWGSERRAQDRGQDSPIHGLGREEPQQARPGGNGMGRVGDHPMAALRITMQPASSRVLTLCTPSPCFSLFEHLSFPGLLVLLRETSEGGLVWVSGTALVLGAVVRGSGRRPVRETCDGGPQHALPVALLLSLGALGP